MATIETQQPRQKTGVKRLVKKTTRVDLTPMVDLGFLLITFFVFTTTLSKPHVMKVNVPYDNGPVDPSTVCASCALTLVPVGDNQLYYYEGMATPGKAAQSTTYAAEGLRRLIAQKKAGLTALNDPTKKLILLIKPGDGANLQNFIDLLDEALINNVALYYIAEPDEADKKMLPGAWWR
jgi:biopolymer transport protein ExbD